MASSFDNQVAQFVKNSRMGLDRAVRGTSISLFGAVIRSTPVDTGRARANWMASGASPSSDVTEAADKAGNKTIAEMTAFVTGAVDLSEFTLTNNLPYAEVLEFGGYPGDGPETVGGYSKQAPHGMVRVNAARFGRIVEEEAAKVRK